MKSGSMSSFRAAGACGDSDPDPEPLEIGLVRIVREGDGQLAEYQHWNPSMLSAAERAKIAASLRETADRMEAAEFRDGSGYVKREAIR